MCTTEQAPNYRDTYLRGQVDLHGCVRGPVAHSEDVNCQFYVAGLTLVLHILRGNITLIMHERNAFKWPSSGMNTHTHSCKHGIIIFMLHMYVCKCETCKYLFELDHDVFGKFHVLKHPLELTGKSCSAFCQHIQIFNVKSYIEYTVIIQIRKWRPRVIWYLINVR